jgi:drug/metabolite transporter (DMT)-like permease
MSSFFLRPRQRGALLVTAGVLLISFDALLVRLAATDGWSVSVWRGLFMAMATLPFACRRSVLRAAAVDASGLWLASFLMATSSLGLVLAFTLTSAANVVVILSAAPLFAALFSYLFLHELTPLRTWLAIAVCCGGVAWVMADSLGHGQLTGDLLAAGATLLTGAYFTTIRCYPDLPRTPVISLGGLLLALFALPLASPFALSATSYGWLFVSGFLQMPLAIFLITIGPRYLPAAEVSLFLLLETVLAPLWVWLVLYEQPPAATITGGVVILFALLLNTLAGAKED